MTVRTRTALDTLPAYAPGRSVPGAIKLASNELSFPTLPAVADAISEAVAHQSAGINRYPDNGAQALVRDARRTHRSAGGATSSRGVDPWPCASSWCRRPPSTATR